MNLQLTRKTILIVDDDPVSVFLFKELIEPTGAHIITADKGHETLEIIKRQPVDLILLDIKLKDCLGYQLIRKIRQIRPEICIIAQTAYAMKEDCRKFLEVGFDDYLPKPIISGELYAKLEKYLG